MFARTPSYLGAMRAVVVVSVFGIGFSLQSPVEHEEDNVAFVAASTAAPATTAASGTTTASGTTSVAASAAEDSASLAATTAATTAAASTSTTAPGTTSVAASTAAPVAVGQKVSSEVASDDAAPPAAATTTAAAATKIAVGSTTPAGTGEHVKKLVSMEENSEWSRVAVEAQKEVAATSAKLRVQAILQAKVEAETEKGKELVQKGNQLAVQAAKAMKDAARVTDMATSAMQVHAGNKSKSTDLSSVAAKRIEKALKSVASIVASSSTATIDGKHDTE